MSPLSDPGKAHVEAASLHQRSDTEAAFRVCQEILAADPGHAPTLDLMGVMTAQGGDPRGAIALMTQAVAIQPENAGFLTNLGLACLEAGEAAQAEEALRRATGRPGAGAGPYHALGDIARSQGRSDEAIALYREALRIDPRLADAHNNVGCILFEAGDSTGAEEAFRSALGASPEHVDALGNLGAVLTQRGSGEAVQTLEAALARKPGDAVLLRSLGLALQRSGSGAQSLEILWRAVQADPDDPVGWVEFSDAFGMADYSEVDEEDVLLQILHACLLKDGVDHQKLARATGQLLRHHEPMRRLLDLAASGGAATEEALTALSDPLLGLVLEKAVIPDPAMERLWTAVRRAILEVVRASLDAPEDGDSPPPFGSPEPVYSLARQCFLNGYVFSYDEEEVRWVESLAAALSGNDLSTDPHNRVRVAILACYVPLHTWDQAPAVVRLAAAHPDPSFVGLLVQQVEEPLAELELAAEVPSLGEAQGAVSRNVQAQYEEHPYPRWASIDHRVRQPMAHVLRSLFPDRPLEGWADKDEPRILIAGCGTGKQLAMVHSRYQHGEIVAIDLSRAASPTRSGRSATSGPRTSRSSRPTSWPWTGGTSAST